jgi:hypothetical protein
MEIIKFVYNDQEINFSHRGSRNVMVNATEMAKMFGKKVHDFLSNENTKNFINSCLKNGNSRFLNLKSEEDLISSRQRSGTWMHRILALKFAAWLDSDFELWVFSTIDQIIFGHFEKQKEATLAQLRAERALEQKKQELLENNPDFIEFLELESNLNFAKSRRLKAIKDSTLQMKLDFGEID